MSIHWNLGLALVMASTGAAASNIQTPSHDGEFHLSALDADVNGIGVEQAGPQHLRITKDVGGAFLASPTPTIAFNVNRADLTDIRVGQAVEIATIDGRVVGRSTIINIKAPFEDGSRGTVMTAALPANASTLPAGTPLKGTVTIEELNASVAVRTLALQYFRDSKAVMVHSGETYQARAVEIGRQTPEWTEIKSGLQPGTRYVSKNVFVLGEKLDKRSPAALDKH